MSYKQATARWFVCFYSKNIDIYGSKVFHISRYEIILTGENICIYLCIEMGKTISLNSKKIYMSFEMKIAQRHRAKLRIGTSGPSGSGKTYSALLLAKGIVGEWDKVALIDTENGSGELYAHLGNYNVINLQAPFSPERYIEAIKFAEDKGMEAIIIDSISHEWDGKGGCLEINELMAKTKFKGNTWSAWSETTPRHQRFIDALTSSKCHIITTARSKTDTIQTEDKKIKKVGLKEIQREGFEYELTVNFNIDRDGHFAIASKDRTGMFIDRDPFAITEKTGQEIIDWNNKGVEPPKPDPILEKKKVITGLARTLGIQDANLVTEVETKTFLKLIPENFDEIITRLKILTGEMQQAEKEKIDRQKESEKGPGAIVPTSETSQSFVQN